MKTADYLNNVLADDRLTGPNFRTFSVAERRRMLEDDLFAGRTVSTVLLTIVALGTVLMLLTVLWGT
jgi:hypothetical protein